MSITITSWEDWDRQEPAAPDRNPTMKCDWCDDWSNYKDYKEDGIWYISDVPKIVRGKKEPRQINVCPDCVEYIENELLPFYRRKFQNESIASFSSTTAEGETE